ncbi:unnamed protein product [Eruca vesicaria subsp. sativa]|uniref:Replication factor A C-terminal domain-containing protein n=1 Tax=Eruca vesicaria subsp. sativa TaxID=29727 RepID=A0ABC8LAW7_ERUVS|nr:unnamed protein product [Eruca vesicaria subsp. sativa]
MSVIVSGMSPSVNNESSTRPYIGFIKPDQAMWYRACKIRNKKVTEAMDTVWFSAFNAEAEKMIGCTADELNMLKSKEGEVNEFQTKMKEARWSSHLFCVSVS